MARIPPYTQMSLKHIRADPRIHQAAIVERWMPNSSGGIGVRKDLFGIIDILAIGPGLTIAIQSTSKKQITPHVRKLTDAPESVEVLRAGWELWIYGWAKPRHRWELTTRQFKIADALSTSPSTPTSTTGE
jgi:hypothetical protein